MAFSAVLTGTSQPFYATNNSNIVYPLLAAQNITATNGSTSITVASTANWVVGAAIFGAGIPLGTTIISFVANTSAVLSNAFTGTTGTVSASVCNTNTTRADVGATLQGTGFNTGTTAPRISDIVTNGACTITSKYTGTTGIVSTLMQGTLTVTLSVSGDNKTISDIYNAGFGYLIGASTIKFGKFVRIILKIELGAIYNDTGYNIILPDGAYLSADASFAGTWISGYTLNGSTYIESSGHRVEYSNFDNSSGGGGRGIFTLSNGLPVGFPTNKLKIKWNAVNWIERSGNNGAAGLNGSYVEYDCGDVMMDYSGDSAGANASFSGSYGKIRSLTLYKCIGGASVGYDTTKYTYFDTFRYFSLPAAGTEVRFSFSTDVMFYNFAPLTYQIPATNTNICQNNGNSELLADVIYPTGHDTPNYSKNYANGQRRYHRSVSFKIKDSSTKNSLTGVTSRVYSYNKELYNQVLSGDLSAVFSVYFFKWGGPVGSYRLPSLVDTTTEQVAVFRKNGYYENSFPYSLKETKYSLEFYMLKDPGYGNVTPEQAALVTGVAPNFSNEILEINKTNDLDNIYGFGGYSLALTTNMNKAVYQNSNGGQFSLLNNWSMYIFGGSVTMGNYNTTIVGSKKLTISGNPVSLFDSNGIIQSNGIINALLIINEEQIFTDGHGSLTLDKDDVVWTPSVYDDQIFVGNNGTLNVINNSKLTVNPTAALGYGIGQDAGMFKNGSTLNMSDSTFVYNVFNGGSGTFFSASGGSAKWNISNSTWTFNKNGASGVQIAIHAYIDPSSVIQNWTINGTGVSSVVLQLGYGSNNQKIKGFSFGGALFGNGTSNILIDTYTYTGAGATIPSNFGSSNKWWFIDPVHNANTVFRYSVGSTALGNSGYFGVIGYRPYISVSKAGYAPTLRIKADNLVSKYPTKIVNTTAASAIPLVSYYRDSTHMEASDGFLPFIDSQDDKTLLNKINWDLEFRQAGWIDTIVNLASDDIKLMLNNSVIDRSLITKTVSGEADINYVNATTATVDSLLISINHTTKIISAVTGTLQWTPQRLYNALKVIWSTFVSDVNFLALTGASVLHLGEYTTDTSIELKLAASTDVLKTVVTLAGSLGANNTVVYTTSVGTSASVKVTALTS